MKTTLKHKTRRLGEWKSLLILATLSWSEATRDGTRVPSTLEMSPRRLFDKLEGARVSLVLDNWTKKTSFVVEQMDGMQSTMFARLGLDRYIVK